MIQPTMTQAPRGGGNRSKTRLALMAIILFSMGIAGNAEAAPGYDLVLANGRVIDPASGLDAVRFVGISDGRIATVSETPLDGKDIVDASGLVIAPGFIDFHAHGQDNEANRLQARDGVTTALDLEGGRFPVDTYYESRAGKALLNYGVAVSHHGIRKELWPHEQHGEDWAYAEADAGRIEEILARFMEGLTDGGIGAGLALEYTPGVGYDEVYRIFRLMAERHAHRTRDDYWGPRGRRGCFNRGVSVYRRQHQPAVCGL